jgi:hypothetical protein
MTRLVAFGCSYTYGKDLEDPETESWPAILAALLETEHTNQSVVGAGNLEILWNILHFDFRPTDRVVIMWSHFTRDHIFHPDGHRRIRSRDDDDLTRHWVLTHDDYDANIRNWLSIHHADLFVKQFAEVYHLFGGTYHLERTANPKCIQMDNIIDVAFENIDFAKDLAHPGPESHRLLAEKIYKIIQ